MIRRLAHLCFMTDNLDRQITFYRDQLGLPVQFNFFNQEGELFGAYFGCGDTTFIEIFDRVLAAKQWGGDGRALQEGTRYNHFCLEVTGIEDVRKLLLSRGVEVGEVRVGMDHSYQAWLADPDGNRVELMEYTHRSWQLQPPVRDRP